MEYSELERILKGTVVLVNKNCTMVSEQRLEIILLLLNHMLIDISPEDLREIMLSVECEK